MTGRRDQHMHARIYMESTTEFPLADAGQLLHTEFQDLWGRRGRVPFLQLSLQRLITKAASKSTTQGPALCRTAKLLFIKMDFLAPSYHVILLTSSTSRYNIHRFVLFF